MTSIRWWLLIGVSCLILSACSDEEDASSDSPPDAEVADMEVTSAGARPSDRGPSGGGLVAIDCPPERDLSVPSGGRVAGEEAAGAQIGGQVTAGEVSPPQGGTGGTGGESVGGSSSAGASAGGDAEGGYPTGGAPDVGDPAGMEASGGASLPSDASSRFDGIYITTFISEGLKMALSRFTISGGRIRGEVINRYGEYFDVQGFIDEAGVLRLPVLRGDQGTSINAHGRVVTSGLIQGAYRVDEREGVFAGALDNRALLAPSSAYDGLYDLSFVRDGAEVAASPLEIESGRFSLSVTNRDQAHFTATGFVTDDGTLVLDSGEETGFEVIAEAQIDVDTLEIEGLYSVGALVGTVYGRAAD